MVDRMAELRARQALELAGLDAHAPLSRMSSVTNEVWCTPEYVIRVARRSGMRLLREVHLADLLPPDAGYPAIIGHGSTAGTDFLVVERKAGIPLAHAWPDLTPEQRRSAVHQLGARLREIHQARTDGKLDPVSGPQLLDLNRPDNLAGPALWALAKAATLPHVDKRLLDEAVALVQRAQTAFDDGPYEHLIHGDIHFENILWDGEQVQAILDFEYSRPGPADLDLDVFLRMCAHPAVHVGAEHEARTKPEQYFAVPDWLRDAYPELFAHPRLLDRLRTYSLAYDVRELLEFPPTRSSNQLPDAHPIRRIEQTMAGTSTLDTWAARW